VNLADDTPITAAKQAAWIKFAVEMGLKKKGPGQALQRKQEDLKNRRV